MLLLYNVGLRLYFFAIYIVSLFNSKARLWIQGRRAQVLIKSNNSIWFHFASLGEFEQGRPVLEHMRNLHPTSVIIITFFSPSGYVIRKNTPLADAVYYLPLDTARNACKFIDTINPTLAIFTKYEYWYHFFNELDKRHIPLYVISGIFRPNQVFFKWYGGLHRKMLSLVSHFFVQDESSKQLLQQLNIDQVTVNGDTRFDRVWANAQHPKALPVISEFKNGQKLFIAGSSWPADEKLVASLVEEYPDWKFIIAPHEIGEDKINHLISLLPEGSAVRFSQISNLLPIAIGTQVLIIDNIGMLSSLYQYADIAYIGGGFGVGIHNTLEAAAFGLPVIFGPNYSRFKEARDLIAIGAGFSIINEDELQYTFTALINDTSAGKKAADYVSHNIGATDKILSYIQQPTQ
jgi:3-deoxy-D-manno-octulosonic-acid transferase